MEVGNIGAGKRMREREEKKEYLRSYQRAVRRERDILEEIQQLRMEKMFPATRLEGATQAAGGSDLSAYAAKIDDLIRQLQKEMLEKVRLRERIERDISRLRDEDEKAVLRYRYIQGLKWEDVCDRIGFSWNHTHRIHAKALDHLKMV